MLSGALKSLFAVAEAYPELKANTNFMQLQTELSDTESKISYARQFFNDTVQIFNTKIEVFPNNLVAGMMGFQMVDYFTLQGEVEARQNVKGALSHEKIQQAPAGPEELPADSNFGAAAAAGVYRYRPGRAQF